MREIKEAFSIPEFRNVLIYLLLTGFLCPSFGSFGYYFMLDVVKISKFTIAMLGVIGFACVIAGSLLFNYCFKNSEIRTLSCYAFGIMILFFPLNWIFVTRQNVAYGLPDMFVIIFSDVVSDTLMLCF